MKIKSKTKRNYEDDGMLPLVNIIFLLLIFFILGTATVGKNTDPFSQFLKSLLPEKTKVFLKKTVFAIPTLFQQNAEQSMVIKKLSKDIGSLKSELFLAIAISAELPRIGSVMLSGSGVVFSLKPKNGSIIKKCAK